MIETSARADRSGLLAGLFCYTAWGLLPLLFRAAARAGAGPFEIVAWRTVWAVPVALAVVLVTRRLGAFKAVISTPRALATMVLSAALIGINWSVYVWAVSRGHILSGSLGYFINPIINMAVGALFFRERMDGFGWAAMALAAAGVALQGLALGAFPWVSVVLAVSFCAYGVVRKQAAADAQTGLLIECLLLTLPAALYLAWSARVGAGVFGRDPAATGWLVVAGPATVIPLFTFALAARKLPLTVLAFIQFIAPTLQFFLGMEAGEPLSAARLASFAFIWAGVAVFALGAGLRTRRRRSAADLQPA